MEPHPPSLLEQLRRQQQRSAELVRQAEVLRRADHLAAIAEQTVDDMHPSNGELLLLDGAVKAYRQVRRV